MKHIDLFSGIGGFALAAREVWGDEYENVLFCDNNKFCQQVLKKNFGKDSVIYGDIREVTADAYRIRLQESGAELEASGNRQFPEIDLLTGGFPCQPFSQAGKRRGTEDNRHLWPQMFRVIQEFKPRWVVAENVRGLLSIEQGVVFEQVCLDLESAGYEVQAFVIPAVAVNAPHRRDRVWIVAHRTSGRPRGSEPERDRQWQSEVSVRNGDSDAQNTISERSGGGMENSGQVLGSESPEAENAGPGWEANWLEVAAKFCGVDDGLPAELDGFKLTKAGHRVERLKALGNAIVPQVAVEIFKGIKSIDERR